MSEWEYHQDERDEAIGIGCLVILFICVILLSAWLLASVVMFDQYPRQSSSSSVMDGSDAGANAVTKEQLRKEGHDV